MPKKKTPVLMRLLPGSVRIVVQIYDKETRSYSQPAGFSKSGIPVSNEDELKDLWRKLEHAGDQLVVNEIEHRHAAETTNTAP